MKSRKWVDLGMDGTIDHGLGKVRHNAGLHALNRPDTGDYSALFGCAEHSPVAIRCPVRAA